MSHFVIAVLTEKGTVEEVERLMAPYHEFECTGWDDSYVQNIDITEKAREAYENATSRMLKLEELRLSAYDDMFYREPTEDERAKIGFFGGTGGNGEFSWHSKDWNDGQGYRTRIRHVPEGWVEIEVPRSETQSFAEFIEDWYGYKTIVVGSQPNLEKEHKFGYAEIDEAGEIFRVIDRTNPNKFWDYWVIGGRWNDYLIPGNKCKVKDIPSKPGDYENDAMFFGIVTPDGKYHSRGRGGWWGAVLDEVADWPKTHNAILEANPEAIAVVVDFHI